MVSPWLLLTGCLGLLAAEPPTEFLAPSERVAAFDALFGKAKRIVEDHLDARLEAALVQSNRGDEWESQGLGFDFQPFAFFRRADRTVVINPTRFETFLALRAKTAKDVEDLGVLLFVHELFHAYQAVEIERTGARELPGRWVRFICEGHAIVFTEEVARSLPVSENVLQTVCGRKEVRYTGRVETDRALAREQFFYRLSAQLVTDRCPKATDFLKLLGTPTGIPEILFCNPGRVSPSPRAHERLEGFAKSAKLKGSRPVMGIDYLEVSLLLCPPVFADRDLCEAYRGGAMFGCKLSNDSSADVFLLHFFAERNEAFVAKLDEYALSHRRAEQRARFGLTDGGFRLDNYPARGRSLYCLSRGPLSLFVAVENGGSGARFARQCFSQILWEDKP